jgi:1-acyl-sn-glycerol-3-phosphate acyltransferase
MTKKCARLILKRCGWKIADSLQLPAKCVICIAPHTSNWDFIMGVLFKSAVGLKAHFFMKKEWFRFPLGNIMRCIGGIPVDRSKKTSLTDQIAAEFDKHNTFYIGVTPEGTRKYTEEWKKGFYIIAQKANVPIMLAYIDYAKKELGYGRLLQPTGDIDADINEIKAFYKGVSGKKPENFGV